MHGLESSSTITLALNSIDRWAAFERLKSLSIPCHCSINRPLCVEIKTAAAALQVWSVVQQVTQPRLALAGHLEICWRQPVR